jgi:deoxyribonuclease-4
MKVAPRRSTGRAAQGKEEFLLLGAHMSIAGGVHTAFERGASIGCTTMQVFVKNNNQWFGKPLTENDVENYKTAEAKTTSMGTRIAPVVAHAAYLINLCATNASTLKLSRTAFLDELKRCEAFGIKALIFHPGAHMGAGEEEGIKRIAESLNIIHEKTKDFKTLTTLEGTAGQGSAIGYRFEHLYGIIDLVEEQNRMAVCLDTCHLFAAGYDVSTEKGWNETVKQIDETVGLERLVAIHMNDSKKPLGSHVDRHEHIGKGVIGLTGFRMLMNDERLVHVPKILETPKGDAMREDVENMNVLRSLIA